MLKLASSLRKATLLSLYLLSVCYIHAQPDVAYQPVIGPGEGLQSPLEVASATGTVAWTCGGSIPAKFRPGSCQ
ncbi:MAG: hypothetical protein EOP49_43245 [Sphingobacteriales bacterium]|nr:MAG: hypothetical protein EOP49_43245 [Sphingobacteriales bacterium]